MNFSSKKNKKIVTLSKYPNGRAHKVIKSRIKKGILKTFYEYAVLSKVNGMYYFQKNVTHGFEKFVWTIIMLLLLTLGGFLIVLLWGKYLDSPTRMTIDLPLTTMQVPYPAITICHPQNVMDYKVVKFIDKVKIPTGVSKQNIIDSLPLIGALTERQWKRPDKNKLIMLDTFLKINNISIYSAMMELGTTCEDFILKCRYAGETFSCFSKNNSMAWKTSTSHLGACCSFNYNPTDQYGTPYSSNTFGLRGGLTLIGTGAPQISDGKSGVIFSSGFMLLIHHPNDFATEAAPFALLKMGTETFVDVYTTESRCSEQVLTLPLSQRKCIIPSDKKDSETIYRQPACTLDCYKQKVYKTCKCHPYQLPLSPNTKMPFCTMLEVDCIVENYYNFKKIDCVCLPSCYDVTYKVSTYVTSLNAYNYSIDPIYKDVNLTDDEFIVQVYLTGQTVSANRKIVVMSWISLLSNLGGAFNLCFGISMLSIIEVFYYIFIRFRHNVIRLPKRFSQRQKLQFLSE